MIHLQANAFVNLLSNDSRAVIYTGMTTHLRERMIQHRDRRGSIFASKYRCRYLMYVESYDRIKYAIYREKQLKEWNRAWKEELIASINPEWEDLYPRLFG